MKKYIILNLVFLIGCAASHDSPSTLFCTVINTPDGANITCPDGSVGILTNGTSGTSGRNGTNGYNGTNGAQGPQGMPGFSIRGERGDMGLTGSVGPTGAQGPIGPRGATGAQGPAGSGCGIVIKDSYYVLKCDDGSALQLKKVHRERD